MSSDARILSVSRATTRETPNSRKMSSSDGARPSSISPLTIRRVRRAATCTGRVRTLTGSTASCLLGMSSAYMISGACHSSDGGNMRIVDVRTAVVAYHGQATLVRIDTDEGLTGYGEANPDAGAGGVVGLIHSLKDLLIGEDPRNVERCWEKLRRRVFAGPQAGVFVIALSGIELALWDLAGKAAGQPVHRLLGGKFRDRIRLYADCGDGDDPGGSPEGCAARARRMVAEGFTAVKFDIDNVRHPAKYDRYNHTLNSIELRTMVERVATVRDAIGPDIDLCIDVHARY